MDSVKRIFLYCLLISMILTAVVGCQTNEPENNTNSETVEDQTSETTEEESETSEVNAQNEDQTIVTFAVNGWERGMYEEMVKNFEEANPDIKIEMVSIDEILDYGGPSASFNSGEDDSLLQLVQGADVASWHVQRGFVEDGLLLDLEPLMTADDNFEINDFYPGTLEQYQWDGGTWGVPTNAGYMVIYYDKDLFDNAGLAYPENGWSWDDFLAAAQATTLRDGAEVTQWGFSSTYMDPMQIVEAKVGPIFNLENQPPTARLDDPEVIDAFEWLIDLYTEYEVAPYASPPETEEEAVAYDQIFMMMEEGKVAMWPDSMESFSWRAEERNLGAVSFPVSDDNMNSSPISNWSGSTLMISAGTAHPEAAWEWLKFLTEQNANEMGYFGSGGPVTLPARQSVAEASGVWDDLDEDLVDTLRFAVEHGFVAEYPPVALEEIYSFVSTVIDEEREVADVLSEAQQAFDDGIEEFMSEAEDAEPIPEFSVAEPPSSQIEEGDTVVRFVVAGGDASVYREAAKQFNELHPDIFVQVEEPNFYNEEFSLQSVIGEADAFQWWSPIRTEDELAAVLAVQPLLSADAELAEEDFFPSVLNAFRAQGQVIGLPGEVQIPFLNYNKHVFDAAGVDYPESGWTLDEFLETAVALTDGDSEDEKIYGYAPDLFEFGDMMTFLALQDVSLIDDSVDPMAANFSDPNTISAIRWYSNLTTEYDVKPTFNMDSFETGGNPYEERLAMIDEGRIAIWKADPYGDFYYDENGELITESEDTSHIGLVPYPTGPGGISSFESMDGYYISAQTEVRQAAWEWLKFLTAQESLFQYGMPARISTAESDEFVQRVGAEKASVLFDAAQSNTETTSFDSLFYATADWLSPAIGIGMENAYQNIISGEMTVEEALQVVQDKADAYRQCAIDNDLLESGEDYEKLESCLEEAELFWDF